MLSKLILFLFWGDLCRFTTYQLPLLNSVLPPFQEQEVLSDVKLEIRKLESIRITCPCDLYPHTHYFYIVILGFTGVYIIFLLFHQDINCVYSLEPLQLGISNDLCFELK